MTKLQDAIRIRDAAYLYASELGMWDRRINGMGLFVEEENIEVLFMEYPTPQGLTWGMDIWVNSVDSHGASPKNFKKVMNLRWDDKENYYILNFKRGNWEDPFFPAVSFEGKSLRIIKCPSAKVSMKCAEELSLANNSLHEIA